MHSILFLSLVLLSAFVHGQTNLPSQYCALKTNTTGQIVIGLTPASNARSSTQLIMRTQYYTYNGTIISLSYIENQGSLFIEETDATQSTKIHCDNTQNTLIYIDSMNQYMLAKQVTNQTSRQFDYALFIANVGSSDNLIKYSFSSIVDSDSNDISKLSIKNIIGQSSGLLYVILQGKTQTSIYTLSTVNGGQISHFSDLSNTQALNINDGNLNYLYDSTNNVFYEKSLTETTLYTAKTLVQLGIDSILAGSTINFVHLSGYMLAYSESNGTLSVLPIGNSEINVSLAVSTSESYQLFTDNYQNLVIVTPLDLIWFRVTDTGLVSGQLSNIALDSTLKSQILEIFNLAQSVSFNSKSAVIIKREPSKRKGSLYSITFDPTVAQKLKILDSYKNSFDYVTSTTKNLITPSAVSGYQSTFACNCISSQLGKMECFATGYNCIAITTPKREICTKS